jgi:hypothetical protein
MVDRKRVRRAMSMAPAATRMTALVTAGFILSGCGAFFADLPGIGQPAGTPARPAVTADYPHVFRTKNPDEKPRPEGEAKKLEAELAQARSGAAEEKRRAIQQPEKRRMCGPPENRRVC